MKYYIHQSDQVKYESQNQAFMDRGELNTETKQKLTCLLMTFVIDYCTICKDETKLKEILHEFLKTLVTLQTFHSNLTTFRAHYISNALMKSALASILDLKKANFDLEKDMLQI